MVYTFIKIFVQILVQLYTEKSLLYWNNIKEPVYAIGEQQRCRSDCQFGGAPIAQLGEHQTLDCKAAGSILTRGLVCP